MTPLPVDIVQEADEVARQCFFPDDDVFECCKGIIAAALLAERQRTARACRSLARRMIPTHCNGEEGEGIKFAAETIATAISRAFLQSQEQEG